MDGIGFDRWTAALAGSPTRRHALRLLGALGLTSVVGPAAVDAKKKKKKITLCFNGQTIKKPKKQAKQFEQQGATRGACTSPCPTTQKMCNGVCIPSANCCTSADCASPHICDGGACTSCPTAQKLCNGVCIPRANCCTAADCASPQVCDAGTCAALRCGSGGPCTVFVTAATMPGGAVAGLAGGDAICQTTATTAGLTGTYRAWLADSTGTPASRFTHTANAGPYQLVANAGDGSTPPPTVAADFAVLTSCINGGNCLLQPINRFETGIEATGTTLVWTGTKADGTVAPNTCTNWTSSSDLVFGLQGGTAQSGQSWTQALSNNCNAISRLYCFEQAV